MFKKILERFSVIKQFAKFAVVGGINTGIDFLVLNVEMLITGITSGSGMFVQNSVSFGVAIINSYYLNKHWTFKDKDTRKEGVKFSQFLIISLIGISINGGIVYAMTTYINPVFGVNSQLWANLAKIAATAVSLFWNFFGYKFLVFKK